MTENGIQPTMPLGPANYGGDGMFGGNGADMTMQDLEKIDKLYHALKSKATYDAMKDAEGYGEGGMSGYRGRAANGRYVSRDEASYADGYSQGYSEAMNQMGNSGRYPMYPRRY